MTGGGCSCPRLSGAALTRMGVCVTCWVSPTAPRSSTPPAPFCITALGVIWTSKCGILVPILLVRESSFSPSVGCPQGGLDQVRARSPRFPTALVAQSWRTELGCCPSGDAATGEGALQNRNTCACKNRPCGPRTDRDGHFDASCAVCCGSRRCGRSRSRPADICHRSAGKPREQAGQLTVRDKVLSCWPGGENWERGTRAGPAFHLRE